MKKKNVCNKDAGSLHTARERSKEKWKCGVKKPRPSTSLHPLKTPASLPKHQGVPPLAPIAERVTKPLYVKTQPGSWISSSLASVPASEVQGSCAYNFFFFLALNPRHFLEYIFLLVFKITSLSSSTAAAQWSSWSPHIWKGNVGSRAALADGAVPHGSLSLDSVQHLFS